MKKYGKDLNYSTYSSKDGGYCVYSVYGEDPNCDMGGPHSNPFLGNVEGSFKEVLEHAANNMNRFYSWGGGGYIVPKKNSTIVEPIVLDSTKKLKRNRKAKLKKLVSSDIERLIEEFDTMTSEEIKESLTNIKKRVLFGKKDS